jgi:hypothetical protein
MVKDGYYQFVCPYDDYDAYLEIKNDKPTGKMRCSQHAGHTTIPSKRMAELKRLDS